MSDSEIEILTSDGLALYGHLWTSPDSVGTLVVAHGIGEHAQCYEPLAQEIAQKRGLIDVLVFDFRGHGRSPGRRGSVRSYSEYLADFEAVLEWVERSRPSGPKFAMGHSNGGLVCLKYCLSQGGRLDGLILSNPALAIALEPPRWKVLIGRVLLLVSPGGTMRASLDHSRMVSDRLLWTKRSADPYRHDRISAAVFFGMLDAGAEVRRRASEYTVPTLLVVSEEDTVIDPVASRAFFDGLGSADKTLISLREARHEPINDFGKEAVLGGITEWLEARLEVCVKSGRRGCPGPS